MDKNYIVNFLGKGQMYNARSNIHSRLKILDPTIIQVVMHVLENFFMMFLNKGCFHCQQLCWEEKHMNKKLQGIDL